MHRDIYTITMNFEKSKISAFLLNLLIPGLGHIYWKEYVFGIFVFLIMLIGVMLFFISFFINLTFWVIFVLLTLPVVFYLFTFIDLVKTIRQKSPKLIRTRKTVIIFIVIGLVYQVVIPVAPVNFCIRNFPQYFVVEKNNLSPLYNQGDILKASRIDYLIDIFFIDKPLLHALPKRYDIIRFIDSKGKARVGMVLGLPNEQIEMGEGVLVINGYPDITEPPGNIMLMGDIELTQVGDFSILAATLNLGTVDLLYEISLNDLIGKVDYAF